MKELRYTQNPPEVRTESREVEGYALVWNSESVDLGGFTEIIDRNALDGVIEKSDVLCLLNHNTDKGVLARSSFGTGSLKLEIDDKGLRYSFTAPNTALGDELLEGLRRNDITSSSFGFTVSKDSFEKRSDGSILRTVQKIEQLYDVSPVYYPAYQATSVDVRSYEEFRKSLENIDMNYEEKIAELQAQIEELRNNGNQPEEKPMEDKEQKSEENPDENKEEENRSEEPEEENKEEKSDEPNEEDKEEKSDCEDTEKRNKFNSVNINMNENRFSLLRTIDDIVHKRGLNDVAAEINQAGIAEARAAGISAGGQFHMPTVMPQGIIENRAAGVFAKQGDTAGGYNIAEEKYSILEPLYSKLLFSQLGCSMLQGLKGDISIPTYSGTSANWAGEIDKAENGAGDWGELKMTPKRLTSIVEISLQFLSQDDNSAEEMLKRDIIGSIQRKLEATVFGDQAATANRPAGLFNAVTPDTLDFTFEDSILMESELEEANIYGPRKYVMAPSTSAILRSTRKDAGSGLFVMDNNQVNGIDCYTTTNVVSKGLILGDWSELVVGSWSGGLTFSIDDISKIDEGKIRLIVNSFWDVLVRRPEAFVKKILA